MNVKIDARPGVIEIVPITRVPDQGVAIKVETGYAQLDGRSAIAAGHALIQAGEAVVDAERLTAPVGLVLRLLGLDVMCWTTGICSR